MSDDSDERMTHWQKVYLTRSAESLSWYRPHLDVSRELLQLAGLSATTRLIDVGAGASTLIDDLLSAGVGDLSALDVSPQALAILQRRLAERAQAVHWYAGDVLKVALPAAAFDIWHDRAVLHFLTQAADVSRYAQVAADAVKIGGHAVIGGFAPDGPERCSGLPVARRSAEGISAIFTPAFELAHTRRELHRTPAGVEQSFVYALMKRRPAP